MDNDETSPLKKTPVVGHELNRISSDSKSSNSLAVGCSGKSSVHLSTTAANELTTTSTKQLTGEEMVFSSEKGTPEGDLSPCPLDMCKFRAGLTDTPTVRRRNTATTSTSTNTSTTSSTTNTPTTTVITTTATSPTTITTSPITQSSTTIRATTTTQATTTMRAPATTKEPVLRPRTTFPKRPDDECMGGIVRWVDNCDVHNGKSGTWNTTRWTELRKQCAKSVPTYTYSLAPVQQYGRQASVPPQSCECCDKRYCHRPGDPENDNYSQQRQQNYYGSDGYPKNMSDTTANDCASSTEDIPFMKPPVCPEERLYKTPQRCNARYGQAPSGKESLSFPQLTKRSGPGGPFMPLHIMGAKPSTAEIAAGTRNYTNSTTPSPSDGINTRFNIVSHISGYDSQLTVPLNTNYMGYSQKYPQHLLKRS